MAQGQVAGLAERICAFPGCTIKFAPRQRSQKFCGAAHRHDAKRLRSAIPSAVSYLEGLLTEIDEPTGDGGASSGPPA